MFQSIFHENHKMEVSSLRCNHCSANLEVDTKIKYFSCSYCGSSLTIKHSGNVMYTEVIDEIKNNTDQLLAEQKVERLDREWMLERERFKKTGKNGNVSYPDESGNGALVGIVGLVVSVLAFLFIVSSMVSKSPSVPRGFISPTRSPGPEPPYAIIAVFLLLFIGVGIFSLMNDNNRMIDYSNEKKKYLEKRKKLLEDLKE